LPRRASWALITRCYLPRRAGRALITRKGSLVEFLVGRPTIDASLARPIELTLALELPFTMLDVARCLGVAILLARVAVLAARPPIATSWSR